MAGSFPKLQRQRAFHVGFATRLPAVAVVKDEKELFAEPSTTLTEGDEILFAVRSERVDDLNAILA
ncbi:MAG: TrkA C-terminal domain-containing protein [Roseobacter sp.]